MDSYFTHIARLHLSDSLLMSYYVTCARLSSFNRANTQSLRTMYGDACVQSFVLPAPGDLLRREGPGLFPVRFVEAERLWADFSTLHSVETTHAGSPLNALTFLHQQTCSLFSEFMWHELNKQLYRQYGSGNATYVESFSGSVVTHDYGVIEAVKNIVEKCLIKTD